MCVCVFVCVCVCVFVLASLGVPALGDRDTPWGDGTGVCQPPSHTALAMGSQ